MAERCQVCLSDSAMSLVLSLGYMPPPNDMRMIGADPQPQRWFPTEMWFCSKCELAQLGFYPDQRTAFPQDYPYESGVTPALRANFNDLAVTYENVVGALSPTDVVVDIGSNDGTLLSCFRDKAIVVGVEPTNAADLAGAQGIQTIKGFFGAATAKEIIQRFGRAKLITCTNCFAHMPDINAVLDNIDMLLADDGVFVTESHYLIDLIEGLQYDTIYAEHLRYYTQRNLAALLNRKGFRIFKVERIPTHGGSIRVFAQRGSPNIGTIIEPDGEQLLYMLGRFAHRVQRNRSKVLRHIHDIKARGGRIAGVGAPTRGATVVNYLGLDSSIVEYVAEQAHSPKVGRYMPGTDIPVVDERRLREDAPDAALLFSWHLANRIVPKLRAGDFRGEIILPCSGEVDRVRWWRSSRYKPRTREDWMWERNVRAS